MSPMATVAATTVTSTTMAVTALSSTSEQRIHTHATRLCFAVMVVATARGRRGARAKGDRGVMGTHPLYGVGRRST